MLEIYGDRVPVQVIFPVYYSIKKNIKFSFFNIIFIKKNCKKDE